MKNMKRIIAAGVACCCIAGISGCETYGEAGGAGAVMGALAGGILGHQSDRAVEGALIGALAGTMGGIILQDIKVNQIRSKSDLEREVRTSGGTLPVEPTVNITTVAVEPAERKVRSGEDVKCTFNYEALGQSAEAPTATLRLVRDDKVVAEQPVELPGGRQLPQGEQQIETTMRIAKNQLPGTYELYLYVEHGGASSHDSVPIQVAA